MERKHNQLNDSAQQESRKDEKPAYPEYCWVSYSDESIKNKEEDQHNASILERSNRFAL